MQNPAYYKNNNSWGIKINGTEKLRASWTQICDKCKAAKLSHVFIATSQVGGKYHDKDTSLQIAAACSQAADVPEAIAVCRFVDPGLRRKRFLRFVAAVRCKM